MFALFVMLCGCSEQIRSMTGSVGTPATIVCYSAGQKIYEGTSTGKPTSEAQSDGYWWVDAKTNKLMEISADCVFTYDQ